MPRQISTGDRTILGRISKRGNTYLRTLFIRGARVFLLRPDNWPKHSFGPWLDAPSVLPTTCPYVVCLLHMYTRIQKKRKP